MVHQSRQSCRIDSGSERNNWRGTLDTTVTVNVYAASVFITTIIQFVVRLIRSNSTTNWWNNIHQQQTNAQGRKDYSNNVPLNTAAVAERRHQDRSSKCRSNGCFFGKNKNPPQDSESILDVTCDAMRKGARLRNQWRFPRSSRPTINSVPWTWVSGSTR